MGTDQARAAFIARITAAATHEIRNVLAIVKESAGLVDDLLAAPGADGAPDRERIGSALGRIEAQVARGAELMTSLNRLAHGLDRDLGAVDLDEAVRHVVRLCHRTARERGFRVDLPDRPDGIAPPTVTANPLGVYRSLAVGLEWCLEHGPEGGGLTVEARGGSRSSVRFEPEPSEGPWPPPGDAAWDHLTDDLDGLPATVEREGRGAGFSLIFG